MTEFRDRQGKVIEGGVLAWAVMYEDNEYRIVAVDGDDETQVWVSTIWTGFSSDGYLFETMVFDSDGAVLDMSRTHTEKAALEAHEALCQRTFGRGARPQDGMREKAIANGGHS